MKQTYDFFNAILNCEALILTGSQALKLYGLADTAEDIDLLVINPSVEAQDLLFNIQQLPSSKHLTISNPGSDYPTDLIRIMHNSIKVDFFLLETKEPFLEIADGTKLAILPNILAAMRRSARTKDIIHINSIATRLSIWI